MDNNEEQEQEQKEEYYDDYNIIPAISFIRIGIGLTQHFFQEQEEEKEEPMETMTYYKKMHKLYHELKNRK